VTGKGPEGEKIMARDTRKEARVARDIIKRRMMPLDIRAAIKGYDITHADHFSCIIGDRKMGYKYSMGDIEVRRQGEARRSFTACGRGSVPCTLFPQQNPVGL